MLSAENEQIRLIADYILDLEHVRRGLQLEKFTLIGHSLGGMLSGNE